jgi:hypothetical protein
MTDWPRHYILVDRVPFAVDLMTWAKWFENIDNRRIAETVINDRCHVSTVFLGLDHNFRGGEPLLFETMIFGGAYDGELVRYATWAQAEAGHADAVTAARIAAAKVDAIAEQAGAKAT